MTSTKISQLILGVEKGVDRDLDKKPLQMKSPEELVQI